VGNEPHQIGRLYKLAADQGNAWARAALLRLGRRQPEKERQRQGDVAVQGATTATTHNNTKSELTWTQILETKGTVTQHITIIWNKLTTSQKISIAVVISLLFMFRYEGPPSDAGPSLARAESVYVKYRGEVDLSAFDCTDVKRSSFIRRVCYDSLNAYMIVRLDGTYYHYCDVDDGIVNAFLAAGSMGRFFDTSIKGHFDCRNGHIPAY
jgi:hypothetical protein